MLVFIASKRSVELHHAIIRPPKTNLEAGNLMTTEKIGAEDGLP